MAPPTPPLHPGDQLACATGTTRVIVIRAPEGRSGTVACGGRPMTAAQAAPARPSTDEPPGALIGKRYVDADDTIELLCTASGAGELTFDGEPLTIKAPKALPASD
ncbi:MULTISPECIES: hypothetical protein [unclassified Streptomyces]|uniref:hypothetical protein n=1 Tax=unclassified Streptomyces TaxID=2593676 RepID=UPI002DD94079|nr:hypothetical protein [Streptomyces sp. NBC_00385]WRZ01929.1 hypothetical protein OG959_00605 [Streptomyces sp. NBC_00385]